MTFGKRKSKSRRMRCQGPRALAEPHLSAAAPAGEIPLRGGGAARGYRRGGPRATNVS